MEIQEGEGFKGEREGEGEIVECWGIRGRMRKRTEI